MRATGAGARPDRGRAGEQAGFALMAVTLVLALLGVVVTELAFSMRLETAMVRSYRDSILGRQLAEAVGVHRVDDDQPFDGLEVDVDLPLPGFLKKRAAKTILEQGLTGLKRRAEELS